MPGFSVKLCLFAFIVFFTLPLFAHDILPIDDDDEAATQEDNEGTLELTLEALMEILVASNVETGRKNQPSTVTVVTRRQLELSGGRTLADALMMLVPGFFVIEDHDDVIAGFRGFAPDNNSKIMLLINGHNMNTEFFWGAPPTILNSINYDWIERVEIVRGPGSVTFGQGAFIGVIGVINIVTRDGTNLKENDVGVITDAGDTHIGNVPPAQPDYYDHYFWFFGFIKTTRA